MDRRRRPIPYPEAGGSLWLRQHGQLFKPQWLVREFPSPKRGAACRQADRETGSPGQMNVMNLLEAAPAHLQANSPTRKSLETQTLAAQQHAESLHFRLSIQIIRYMSVRQCPMVANQSHHLPVSLIPRVAVHSAQLQLQLRLRVPAVDTLLILGIVHFFAGLSSGILSAVLLQPADLLKTRVQQAHQNTLLGTIRAIASGPNPIRQFWRGTLPSTLRTGCGSAIYFSSLNALRREFAREQQKLQSHRDGGHGKRRDTSHSSSLPKLSNSANLATGAVARVFAGFLMMPITVIKVRYESNLYSYTSLWQASSAIFKSEGLRGFFAGFGATAVRDAPYAGLYVLFYEQSKKRLSKLAAKIDHQTSPDPTLSSSASAGINFASGIAAAGLGTTITNPFDAIKTRLQLMPDKYLNMAHAAKKMLKEEGIASLFDGLGIRIARKAMSSALAWTVYEELIRRAEVRWQEQQVA